MALGICGELPQIGDSEAPSAVGVSILTVLAVAILVACQRCYISMRPSDACTPSSLYALGASECDVYECAKDRYRGG